MRTERRIHIVAFLIIVSTILLSASFLSATVKTTHPRIWLTDERKAVLIERFNSNTIAAQNLASWCDGHIYEDLSGYTESRSIPTLKAINYALMYQLTGDTDYADRAIEIIEYLFAHPYSGYTIDTWIQFDHYYSDRYLMPPVAIVLDWCWDHMSSIQRNSFISQLDTWAADLMAGNAWAWEEPSGNYYFGHMWAMLTTAYALHGHVTGGQSYLDRALLMLGEGIKYTKGEDCIWGYMGNYTGRSNGGLWNEGTSYGCVDNEFISAAVLAVRSAEPDKENYPESGFPFPNEVIQFYIHALYPSGDHTYSDGDGATWSGVGPTTRVPILLCTALADPQWASYGKYWLDAHTTPSTWDYKLYLEFMWYPEEVAPADYRPAIDKHYFARGSQVLFWRSGWDVDDTWMAFRIGVLNTGHAQNGLGHFIVYDKGNLVVNKADITNNGMEIGDVHHNVLFVPPVEEKRLYWGCSEIEHLEDNPFYLYLAGDMSPVYNAQPDYRNNTVDVKEREFFILKEEKILLVMDRGRSFDPSVDKTFQLYLHEQAVASGSDYRVSNGSSDLIVHTAYPDDASVGLDTYGVPRMRVTTAASELEKTFLHLLKVTGPGGSLQTFGVDATGANMIGTVIDGDNLNYDYLVMFSNDIAGGPVTEEIFRAVFTSFGNYIVGYVLNLEPNTEYYYSDSHAGLSVELVISKNDLGADGPVVSSENGVLILGIQPGENPAPPPPPGGMGIRR